MPYQHIKNIERQTKRLPFDIYLRITLAYLLKHSHSARGGIHLEAHALTERRLCGVDILLVYASLPAVLFAVAGEHALILPDLARGQEEVGVGAYRREVEQVYEIVLAVR